MILRKFYEFLFETNRNEFAQHDSIKVYVRLNERNISLQLIVLGFLLLYHVEEDYEFTVGLNIGLKY